MARPIREKSVSGASSTATGNRVGTGGRITVSLYVVAKNLDTVNDTLDVQLEASQDDGANWAKLRDKDGNQIGNVTVSEFDDPDGGGDYAAFVTIHGVAADFIRANITSFTDSSGSDLTVDAWVSATDNSGTSHNYRKV
ncbi:MAG: hypothetical protein ABEK59_11780 [Halobacteria archaeon]